MSNYANGYTCSLVCVLADMSATCKNLFTKVYYPMDRQIQNIKNRLRLVMHLSGQNIYLPLEL